MDRSKTAYIRFLQDFVYEKLFKIRFILTELFKLVQVALVWILGPVQSRDLHGNFPAVFLWVFAGKLREME